VTTSAALSISLRTLLNIANGYEPRASRYIDDRYEVYNELIFEKQEELKKIQTAIDEVKLAY